MPLEDYKEIVGTSAMVTTIGQMFAGTIICKDIYHKGNSEGFDPMPFIGGTGMCILMLQYALILGDQNMINVNICGLLLNLLYVIFYYLYSPNKSNVHLKIAKAVAFLAIILGYMQIESSENLEFRCGIIITVLMLLLLGAPLFNLGEIIKTKSTESLPFPLILMATLVTFQWLLYGIIIDNVFVIFQNAVGFVLSAAQLSLFAIYPSKPVEQEKLKKK
ncbi:sugar transporter SWEET1 [Orussus abietinus]|uniref:sugar transporter SWEET1 n=1 Tax=Orussus abietinus TaxID=222816 RepID=UPI000625EC89|nr:sugar transporter SWEET1 [Orussus abietinus]XP_012282803.1 sugar transporter SWEET1 [Orussus abietinus]